MKLKPSDIDYVSLLRRVMEAAMDGKGTSSIAAIRSEVIPSLLPGDVMRAGGETEIIGYALGELKRKKSVEITGEGDDATVSVLKPSFPHNGKSVVVLDKEGRDELKRQSFIRLRLAQEWDRVASEGQLPGREIGDESVLASIREYEYQLDLGKIVRDEHGVIISGRNRDWALRQLNKDPSRFTTTRKYGEDNARRLRDAILDNVGAPLSAKTIKLLAGRVLPDIPGATLDDLLGVMALGKSDMAARKELALHLVDTTTMSQREIAKAVGVSEGAVRKWLRTEYAPESVPANGKVSGRKIAAAKDPAVRSEYRQLKAQGKTNDEISGLMGISEGTRHQVDSAVSAEDTKQATSVPLATEEQTSTSVECEHKWIVVCSECGEAKT